MLEFIKMFGLGMLYTLLFPLIVLFFGLSLVYVFINYLVNESMHIFGFFFGYTFTVETELEKKLKEMKEENKKVQEVSYAYNEEVVSVEEGSDNNDLY